MKQVSLAELENMAKHALVEGEGAATVEQLVVYAKHISRFLADFCEALKQPREPEPPLPIDTELVEALAFAFLRGEFQSMRGGFPSVAFHDGYREYDERMESWLSGRIGAHERRKYETEYAAGAFALHLEREGVEV